MVVPEKVGARSLVWKTTLVTGLGAVFFRMHHTWKQKPMDDGEDE